ncbi:MAG: succinylglutamate desuccinylase/aspartoacylase family protein [Ectothiorhodospiraceae bacterium]|nr:succinylglutamate desuccinylase/aspartoacylase family protein [Ectothiorhodospiraceae bacterium]
MLTLLDHIPCGLLDSPATELYRILSGPTLIQLPGRRPHPLFVSVLLHGNETTGLLAIQSLLKKYQQSTLPRALCIFIGNVAAARYGQRHIDGQPDFNRVWPVDNRSPESEHSGAVEKSSENKMMQQIVDTLRAQKVFVSIDVHNNTGLNPHYACINRLETAFFHIATQFSRTVVYFTKPSGVQSMAFSKLCPAVTVECGKPDQPHGTAHAADLINTCLHLSELPTHSVAAHDMDLFHTVATVTVPNHIDMQFDGSEMLDAAPAAINFLPDLDHLNFHELATGITLAYVNPGQTEIPLLVEDESGKDVTHRYFALQAGELRTAREVMPSMFTLNKEVIRQDCLGYLMERMDWHPSHCTTPSRKNDE